MGRGKKKGGRPQKKVGSVHKKTRCRYSSAIKQKAIYLRESGMTLKQIKKWFMGNEDPNTCDTNESLIDNVNEYNTCLMCNKKVYNKIVQWCSKRMAPRPCHHVNMLISY